MYVRMYIIVTEKMVRQSEIYVSPTAIKHCKLKNKNLRSKLYNNSNQYSTQEELGMTKRRKSDKRNNDIGIRLYHKNQSKNCIKQQI